MKKILVCFLLLPYSLSACLNTYDYTLSGGYVEANEGVQYMLDEIWKDLETGEKKAGNKKDLEDFYEVNHHHWTDSLVSDYAALLIKDSRLKEAKTILDSLIKKEPNNYTYNANYGTLMELMGHNEKALYHIKKAVEIDPGSHAGSEWIHVKILEAKIALAKDPNWLNTHSVIKTLRQLKMNPYDYVSQVGYQLEERTYFIREKDEIVCDLFFYMGKVILEKDMGIIVSRRAFELSLRYGRLHEEDCKSTLRLLNMLPADFQEEDITDKILHMAIWTGLTFLLFFGFVMLVKTKKRARF